ncbi:bis(5'-nucleosyl)-tetraphosphatase (symmetrical) [Methylohalomonas lacus]|uniref:Bis(5'-nucleosyl)-tetraphosphatase, symmetrical n=1 Tax=Methylohalomonas lacus TaxID=398773 RepID=A0AAE3HMX3_9GAMM|nr:symmetrical bis(5'-nucleosyl)-tetraphosphatase [Methylohalomonas lacus]MCS3904308.1 bis(5'-nucleosyl)-tetraphosphatase (symmetrical) [Methylohalomonas lacus]
MSTYAIGDLQGCYQELLDLLDLIEFDDSHDRLWFVGDIINRGPESLETLRFVHALGDTAVTVLGNHDLHLLAVACANAATKKKDTLAAILAAPDRELLLDWLRHRPLLHHDAELGYVMAHAGLPPAWDLARAQTCAAEVSDVLAGSGHVDFLKNIYGNKPDQWDDALTGLERWRYTVNALTRMRYCHIDGRLALEQKGPPGTQDHSLKPWFEIEQRHSRDLKIVFGHWSTLRLYQDDYSTYNVFPLDTGCVWGGALTAMRLEDEKEFSVPSRQPAIHD